KIGHKAGLKTAVEGAKGELVGKLPTCPGTYAYDLCHCVNIRASFDAKHKRLGYGGSDCTAQHLVHEFDNFAGAIVSNVKNILLFAHSLQNWQCLFKNFTFATYHDSQRTIDGSLRAAADGGIQEVRAVAGSCLCELTAHTGSNGTHIDDNQPLARALKNAMRADDNF